MNKRKIWIPLVLILAAGSAYVSRDKAASKTAFGETLWTGDPCITPVNCSPSGTLNLCEDTYYVDKITCKIFYVGPDRRI